MRGIFGTIAAPRARASAGVPSYGMIPPLGSVQSASGVLVSQATAMCVSTVYACVNRIATDLARCRPSLYRLNDDGSETPVRDHPVADLFMRPNQQQTWYEFAWQMWVGHLLRGNAYAASKTDRRGIPQQLIPVNPDAVMVLEAGDGSVFYNVNRIGLWQIAMLAEFPVAIPEESVLHLRGLTFNSLVGVSTIGLARDAIGLSSGLEQQAARWIAMAAQPATWLKTMARLSEPAAKRLKAQFDGLHGGYQNTGKTLVLEEGLEPVALQLKSVDMEFIAQRQNQVLDICRFYNVPPHKVGVVDRGSSQNIAQQDQDYVNTTIMQRVELGEQKIARFFDLDRQGIRVKLDQGQLLRADVLTRRNAARLGILSSITTPDEERRAEGLPAKGGWAAELQRPQNMAPQGSDISGQGATGGGRPPNGTISDGSVGTGGTQSDSGADPGDDNTIAGASDTPPQN